ncbi:MAG TPA: glycosyltransferase family 2 protein [Myxococcota bacterium]|jgi:cellulose synthase/poly-beta-1,6-N-acetylglucosamine synthase-like glycosyltransferase
MVPGVGELAIVLAGLSLVFVASAYGFARRQLRALVPVTPQALTNKLLVIIPARNEAARIGATLQALLRAELDEGAALHILVVDDRSSDGTAALVEQLASETPGDVTVRVLRLVDDPPAGAFGKPRALHAAVQDARSRGALTPLVLFLDADVVLEPAALGGLVRAHDHCGADALSGVPRLVTLTRAEQLFVPALASVVTNRAAPTRVHSSDDATAFLNGQLILVDSAALDDAGGFAAVERTVLEDVALARALKARGKKLRLADLRMIASTRMYESFAEIDAGFGKNATALLGKSAFAVGIFAFLTSLLPAAALVFAGVDASPLAVAALVLVALVTALQVLTRKLAGAPVWPVLVLPLVYAGVMLVLVRASFARTVTWRGRVY